MLESRKWWMHFGEVGISESADVRLCRMIAKAVKPRSDVTFGKMQKFGMGFDEMV